MENSKNCRVCKISKSISEFRKDKSYKDGIGTICKKCHSDKNKKSYQKQKQTDTFAEEIEKLKNDMIELLYNSSILKEDEIDEQGKIIIERMQKLRLMKSNNILILSQKYNEDIIKSVCQQVILSDVVKIVNPDQIFIENFGNGLKVVFPEDILMNDPIKKKITDNLQLSGEK